MTDQEIRDLKERLQENSDKIDLVRTVDIPGLKVDIAGLKVTARIWGAVAGIVGSAIGAVILALVLK